MRIETKIVINSAFRILNKQNGCVPVKGRLWSSSDPHLFSSGQHGWPWGSFWGWMGEFPPLHGSVTLMVLCWGSDHISRCQGTSFTLKTWCCCTACTPEGEELLLEHISGFSSC